MVCGLVSSVTAYQCNIKMSYRQEKGIKCTAKEMVGKMERTKCTVACTLENDALCLAYNYTEDNNCELCLACPNYQQTYSTWSNISEVNVFKMTDFENRLNKGK